MFCSNCGKEITQDDVYCPGCGLEVQLVPEFLDLEDLVLDEEALEQTRDVSIDRYSSEIRQPEQESSKIRQPEREKGRQENVRPTVSGGERPKDSKRNLTRKDRVLLIKIIALSVFIVAVVTVFLVFMSFQNKNTDTQYLKKAQAAMKEKDYKTALEYYQNAREKNSKNLEVVKGLAECYYELGDYESAALYYLDVAGAEPNNKEVFKRLLEIYGKTGDMEGIKSLYRSAQTQEIKDLFASYLLAEPQFSIEEGTYNELTELTLSLTEPGEIYYTTDGTAATKDSTPFKDPIPLPEGKTVVHAIAITQSGKVSDEIIKTYEIVLETPKAPGILPESGKFTEPTKIELTIPEGAKAYYTTDGTVPTEQSKTCGSSFSMPIGNNVISVLYIDKNNKTSEVVKRNYDLAIDLSVGQDVIESTIKKALLNKGEIDNMDGYKEGSDGVFEFAVLSMEKIYNEDYYIVEKVKKFFSGESKFVGYYAYKISDGKLYTATLDDTGSYKLSAF